MLEEILEDDLGRIKGSLRPNQQRAKNATVILILIMLVDIFGVISSYMQINLLEQFQLGVIPSDSEITSNDNREALSGILQLVVLILGGVLFIQWFRRAYYNLGQITEINYSDGWAAGGWFVPILTYFRPYQIMNELWTKTLRILREKSSSFELPNKAIIGVWWAFWVIITIIENATWRIGLDSEEISDFINSSTISIITGLLSIPAAILAILVIKQYSKMEVELLELTSSTFDSEE